VRVVRSRIVEVETFYNDVALPSPYTYSSERLRPSLPCRLPL